MAFLVRILAPNTFSPKPSHTISHIYTIFNYPSLPFFLSLPSSLSFFSARSPPMASDNSSDDLSKYGFQRSEMYSTELADTVDPYNRHVFLCYKSYDAWLSRVEDSDLPKLLNSSIKARKDEFPLKTRLTVCNVSNGIESSDGDVLIFPDMVKYRGLKESDVESFVDDVLVNGKPWSSGVPENLTAGAYIFVCAHASRDKRCGVCGPILIEKFNEEIEARQLNEQAFVSACSHVGGHKYAGNVIIFSPNDEGKVVGDWYGYVTPADIPNLLDAHIGKREIVEKLWRGEMGSNIQGADGAKKTAPKENVPVPDEPEVKQQTVETEEKQENNLSCCQGPNGVSCCRDNSSLEVNGDAREVKPKQSTGDSCKTGVITLPSWMGRWDQSDVVMVAGVVGAVVTAAVAFSIFRSRRSA